MRTLIYIDPGVSGALACRCHDGRITVDDLPTVNEPTRDGKARRRVDGGVLTKMLHRIWQGSWAGSSPVPIIGVEAPPHINASKFTAARQWMNYGICLAAAESCCPSPIVEPTRPKEVVSHHGIGGGTYAENKAEAVEKACEVWPELGALIKVPPTGRQRTTQIKDGRADALLGLKFMIDREEREG